MGIRTCLRRSSTAAEGRVARLTRAVRRRENLRRNRARRARLPQASRAARTLAEGRTERQPKRGSDLARLGALHQQARARYIDGMCTFELRSLRAWPAETHRQIQLRTRVFARAGE